MSSSSRASLRRRGRASAASCSCSTGYRAPLAPLLTSLPGVDEVVTKPAELRGDGAIARTSILSLPFHLRVSAMT
jgi:hypothetical protein